MNVGESAVGIGARSPIRSSTGGGGGGAYAGSPSRRRAIPRKTKNATIAATTKIRRPINGPLPLPDGVGAGVNSRGVAAAAGGCVGTAVAAAVGDGAGVTGAVGRCGAAGG